VACKCCCECGDLPDCLCLYFSHNCLCLPNPACAGACHAGPDQNCETLVWVCNRLERSVGSTTCLWTIAGHCAFPGGDCGPWEVWWQLQRLEDGSWQFDVTFRFTLGTLPAVEIRVYQLRSTIAADGDYSCDPFALVFSGFEVVFTSHKGNLPMSCPDYESMTVTILQCPCVPYGCGG